MSSLIESIVASIQNNIALVLIILGIIVITYTISLAVIFQKVGNKSRYAFIPIYNIMTLLSILRIPKWMILIMVIPFVNIIGFLFMSIIIGYKLGSLCRKNFLMKMGLMFLSPIFYPLLAFTDIDVDGSKLDYVIEKPKKEEFKLDPVVMTGTIDAPEAMNLSDAENVDKITIKKVKQAVEKKDADLPNISVEEHLAKANKEMPTAQDLTFDYNLIYNSRLKENVKVEEVVKEEVVIEAPPEEVVVEEPVVEEQIVEEEVVDDTPFVPVLHEITLGEASPIDTNDIGPVPLNQRYDIHMNANKQKLARAKEIEREKAKEVQEEISQVPVEPMIIIDNGPINLDSSLSGLVAAAPDFNAPAKPVVVKEEVKEPEVVEPVPVVTPTNIQTTEVQEIVSMNIVEPSQLPVKTIPKEEKKEEIPNEQITPNPTNETGVQKPAEPQFRGPVFITNNIEPTPSLLRPVGNNDYSQVDKTCPQCNAKMRRDCPVCFICGYHFIE